MSPRSKKRDLVQRSVVELDLAGYSHVARILEEQLDAGVVQDLNDQVQDFVNAGLREVGCKREEVVYGTAGDNALVLFERASEAHRFAEAVHRAATKHNASKTDPAAHRNFRIGISTGEISVRGKQIAGKCIIDSVRLEAAGQKGHVIIDAATYDELPGRFQPCYRGPETVTDKQKIKYEIFRYAVIEVAAVTPPASLPAGNAPEATGAFHADISRIVKYAPEELIGREAETRLLSDAWEKATCGESPHPHVLTFVALGGEGKTSLVAKWAAELAHRDWPGCEAAYAWSFYSQGTREQMAASSDLFLKEALIFFRDPETAGSAQTAFDKGRRLAQLVGERRALLILDGLEPLQYAPTSPTPGELKDQGLAALLKGLAAISHGLCVVTTRYSIPDLRAYWQTTAPEEKLTRLSKEAGVALLRSLGVKGTQREFETLVEDVQGHALTLNLLGSYLRDAHAGDIRKRDLVKLEEADAEEQGGHAFRVMDAYVKWLEGDPLTPALSTGSGEGARRAGDGAAGRRALAVLRLLGLFDRPATADCLAALQKAPVIPGLTESFFAVENKWLGLKHDYHPIEPGQLNISFTRLEAAKLLTVNRDKAGTLISLDAHPLLREYFGRDLRTQQPEAWRAAHRRLYEHLCAITKYKPQPTLEDLQPLYQAVAHGCQAGMQKEACDKVYDDRIQRGREAYSTKKLGALGADLGAIACFFEEPWSRVSPALTEEDQSWLLNEAAFCLRALGRLTEALDPFRAGLVICIKQKAWPNTAQFAGNLSELELTLGEVAGAVEDAEQSVTYADRSGDATQKMIRRATHAAALNQAGHRAEAEARFREAEAMQAERQPDHPLLYSLRGFQYCDLLLAAAERAAWLCMERPLTLPSSARGEGCRIGSSPARGVWGEVAMSSAAQEARCSGEDARASQIQSCRDVAQRATQTLQWAMDKRGLSLLDIALDHLTLGRATLYEAILAGTPFDSCRTSLQNAVDGLRRAGAQNHLSRGLLTRAWLRSLTGARTSPASAQRDLDEACEIAERGPMPLFLADIHLHRARLFFREKPYPWQSPQADLAEARRLIEKHGYGRRKEELEDAEEAAKSWPDVTPSIREGN